MPFWSRRRRDVDGVEPVRQWVRAGVDADAAELASTPLSTWGLVDRNVRHAWRGVRPEDVRRLADGAADPAHAVASMAMNRSGYVRQKALDVLTERDLPTLIPICVIRAADWVEPVRDQARLTLDAALSRGAAEELLPALGLLRDRAEAGLRQGQYLEGLLGRLAATVRPDSVIPLLSASDAPVRRAAAHLLVAQGEADRMFPIALERREQGTVQILLRGLTPTFWTDRTSIDRALASPFSSVQSAAFFHLNRLDPEAATDLARANLFSRRRTLRSAAQRHLSDLGEDVADRYRAALDEAARAALVGLAEVGGPQDVVSALPLLDHDDHGVRAAAVALVGRHGGPGHQLTVATALRDPSPQVISRAARALRRSTPTQAVLQQVWDIAVRESDGTLRDAAFTVLLRAGRWQRLTTALRSLSSDDHDLAARGHDLLVRTLREWNRSATGPDAQLIAELRATVPAVLPRLDADVRRHVEFVVRRALPDESSTPGASG